MAWNGTDLAWHSDGRKGRNIASMALTSLPLQQTLQYTAPKGVNSREFFFFVSPLGNALRMELSLLHAHPQHQQRPWCTWAKKVVGQQLTPWCTGCFTLENSSSYHIKSWC